MQESERSSRSPLTLMILIGFMVISTLVVMSNYFIRPSMESGLAQKITENLHSQGLLDMTLKIRGEDVTLTGHASNNAEAIKAEKMIQEIWGIHKVDNKLVIKKQTIE